MFRVLRAILTLARTLKSLEETLLARTLLDYPQLEGLPLERYYTRAKITSPLLRELYDRRSLRRELPPADALVNYESLYQYKELYETNQT